MYRCAAIARTFSHADRLAASSTSDDGVPLYARAWDDAPVSLVSRALTHYGDLKSERTRWRRRLLSLFVHRRSSHSIQRNAYCRPLVHQERLAVGQTALMTVLLPFLAHMRQQPVCRVAANVHACAHCAQTPILNDQQRRVAHDTGRINVTTIERSMSIQRNNSTLRAHKRSAEEMLRGEIDNDTKVTSRFETNALMIECGDEDDGF